MFHWGKTRWICGADAPQTTKQQTFRIKAQACLTAPLLVCPRSGEQLLPGGGEPRTRRHCLEKHSRRGLLESG